MKSGIEAPPKRYRYTGMERDEESGLGYHMARYCVPWLGRWVSYDPLGTDGGINCWLYAYGNPLLFSDSNGQRPRRPEEEALISYYSTLAASKEASSGFLDSLWAALPPFSRSARGDANVLRAHVKRLSAAIENAREGEDVLLWPVEHQPKYWSFSEGRDLESYVTIATPEGPLELQRDPEYMRRATFEYRAALLQDQYDSWTGSGMDRVAVFNTLTASMGNLEAGSTSANVRAVWRMSPNDFKQYGLTIKPLLVDYKGEHLQGFEGENLQGNTVWPDAKRVKYFFSKNERARFALTVKSGLLLDAQGKPFDTRSVRGGRAIFVMDVSGEIYAYLSQSKPGRIHHASLVGGEPVAMAGEMKVEQGRVTVVSNKSGHYQPTWEMMVKFNQRLARLGVEVSKIQLERWSP